MRPVVYAWSHETVGQADPGHHRDHGQVDPCRRPDGAPLHGEEGSESTQHSEYGAARSRSDGDRVHRKAEHASRQARNDVYGREPEVAVCPLYEAAEEEQAEPVEQHVRNVGVEEHCREEAPVLAVRNQRAEHRAEVEQDLGVLARTCALGGGEHQQVRHQQGICDHGTPPGRRPRFVKREIHPVHLCSFGRRPPKPIPYVLRYMRPL